MAFDMKNWLESFSKGKIVLCLRFNKKKEKDVAFKWEISRP